MLDNEEAKSTTKQNFIRAFLLIDPDLAVFDMVLFKLCLRSTPSLSNEQELQCVEYDGS